MVSFQHAQVVNFRRAPTEYRLMGVRQALEATPHLQLTLVDATGTVTGFVWPESRPRVTLPAIGAPVRVRAQVRMFRDRPRLAIIGLAALAPDDISSLARLLVEASAPVRAAIDKLERSLPPVLRQFVCRVLLDSSIGPAFMRCRGSAGHHHARRGGLACHSVENLDLIRIVVARAMPTDAVAPALAQIGYLFHDLGKIDTVGTACRPPWHAFGRHETHTLLRLAPHLAWLEQRAPELHAALVSILEYVATPAPARRRPRYRPAEVVVMFDQLSAASFSAKTLDQLAGAEC